MPREVLVEVPLAELRRRRRVARRAGGREVLLLETRQGVRVYSGVCPHLAGPLLEARVEDDRVVCPWHRYAFDAGDGRCLSVPGAPWRGLGDERRARAPLELRLTTLPFEVRDGRVRVFAGAR